jgi:uncharacterized delta-60 repeat protein
MRQRFTRKILGAAILLSGLGSLGSVQAQVLDPSFQPTEIRTPLTGSSQQSVNALAVQPDGKVLVAGGFDFVNGPLTGKLQRLNSDGSTDPTFNVDGTGANGFISVVLRQPDGKYVVGGGFTTFNGQPRPMVVRLNADGSLDTGFTFGSAASSRQISSMALQPDGKILVGSGLSFSGTPQTGGVVRLNADGSLDSSFSVGTGTTQATPVQALLVLPDGKILVGGLFPTFNGQPVSNNNIVRLTSTGAVDPSFSNTATNSGIVYTLARQPDGKILAGGNFQGLNGRPSTFLVRLLPDGADDNTFQANFGTFTIIRQVLLDAAGRILVCGPFTQVDGAVRNTFARLTASGSLDASFAAGTGIGPNNQVIAMAQTPTGQILLGGTFAQYDGLPTSGVARLNEVTGIAEPSFVANIEARGFISQAVPTTNSQLLVSGSFTKFNGLAAPGVPNALRRVNADGSLDVSFAPTVTGTVWNVQPDGRFYVVSISPNYAVRRLLPSGLIDNTFTTQAFGPTSGTTNVILQGVTGLPDGKLLVFGRFTSYGSLTGLNGLVRLNPDGSPDNTFGPSGGSAARRITQVQVQPSGKLVVVSDELSNSLATVIVRLNANGTPDNTFSVGTGAGTGATYRVLIQPDGRLLVSGLGASFNGQPTPYGLARLTADGAVDATFSGLTEDYFPLAVQADGRLLAIRNNGTAVRASSSVVRLTANGSLDPSFTPVATPQSIFSGDDIITGAVIQPADGKVVLFGSFRYVAGQVRIGLARLSGTALANRAAQAARPMELYPNPARNGLTVKLPAAAQVRPATLLDLQGRRVRQWTLPARQAEARFSLDAIPAGVYLLQVQGSEDLYQQRVVITR